MLFHLHPSIPGVSSAGTHFFFFLANSYLLFKLVSSSSKAFLGIYTPLYSVPFLWAPNASSSICDCCPRHVFLALSPVNVSVLDLLDFKVFEEKQHSTHRRYVEETQIAASIPSPNPAPSSCFLFTYARLLRMAFNSPVLGLPCFTQ